MRSVLPVVVGAIAGVALMIMILAASSIGRCVSVVDGIRVGHVLMSSRCAE